MKRIILTVTLNPAIDKTVYVDDFSIGKDFRESSLYESAGGKGINVARTLRYLGIPCIATGFLGGSSGLYIKQELDREKIKCDFTEIKGNSRTSLTVIDPKNNKITRILERGPVVSAKERTQFKRDFVRLLKFCDFVTLSGRIIPGINDAYYAQLITIAQKSGVRVVFDTSGSALSLGLKKMPFMIKPNLGEAESALNTRLQSLSSIIKAIKSFHQKRIPIVAITMGSKGAVVSNGQDIVLARPPKIKRKNPVGCGDAFIAGFLYAYSNSIRFATAVKSAVACGAANAISITPGLISRKQLQKTLPRVSLKNL